MHFVIKYGVSKNPINSHAFDPVVFVNGVSQYTCGFRSTKTPKGALNRAEKLANSIADGWTKFNNSVEIVKWEHSVI